MVDHKKVIGDVKGLRSVKTNKLTIYDRMGIYLNEAFQKELANRLKQYRAAKAITWPAFGLVMLSLLLFAFGFLSKWIFFICWIPLIIAAIFFKNPYTAHKSIVWDFLEKYLKDFGFQIVLNETGVGALPYLSDSDIKDLLNKETAERVILDNKGLYFKSDKSTAIIKGVTVKDISENSKGEKSESTVFSGVVVQLAPMYDYEEVSFNTDKEIDLQIAPISKIGRLWQNTLSSFSEVVADIKFYNDDLNNVMSMKSENFFWEKKSINEKISGLHSASFEEVLLNIYENYGVFYLKVHKGKVYLALSKNNGLFKKSFNPNIFPYYSMENESFNPERWGELFYFIGLIEALTYYIRLFNTHNKEDADEYSTDYTNLSSGKPNFKDYSKLGEVFEKFKKNSYFPKISTLDKIKSVITEKEEEKENE